jgi:hypothetical protein
LDAPTPARRATEHCRQSPPASFTQTPSFSAKLEAYPGTPDAVTPTFTLHLGTPPGRQASCILGAATLPTLIRRCFTQYLIAKAVGATCRYCYAPSADKKHISELPLLTEAIGLGQKASKVSHPAPSLPSRRINIGSASSRLSTFFSFFLCLAPHGSLELARLICTHN